MRNKEKAAKMIEVAFSSDENPWNPCPSREYLAVLKDGKGKYYEFLEWTACSVTGLLSSDKKNFTRLSSISAERAEILIEQIEFY
jgi:hypothetical protein